MDGRVKSEGARITDVVHITVDDHRILPGVSHDTLHVFSAGSARLTPNGQRKANSEKEQGCCSLGYAISIRKHIQSLGC